MGGEGEDGVIQIDGVFTGEIYYLRRAGVKKIDPGLTGLSFYGEATEILGVKRYDLDDGRRNAFNNSQKYGAGDNRLSGFYLVGTLAGVAEMVFPRLMTLTGTISLKETLALSRVV